MFSMKHSIKRNEALKIASSKVVSSMTTQQQSAVHHMDNDLRKLQDKLKTYKYPKLGSDQDLSVYDSREELRCSVSPPTTRLPHVAAQRLLGPIESGACEGPQKERRRAHSSVGINPMNRQRMPSPLCARRITVCGPTPSASPKSKVDSRMYRRQRSKSLETGMNSLEDISTFFSDLKAKKTLDLIGTKRYVTHPDKPRTPSPRSGASSSRPGSPCSPLNNTRRRSSPVIPRKINTVLPNPLPTRTRKTPVTSSPLSLSPGSPVSLSPDMTTRSSPSIRITCPDTESTLDENMFQFSMDERALTPDIVITSHEEN